MVNIIGIALWLKEMNGGNIMNRILESKMTDIIRCCGCGCTKLVKKGFRCKRCSEKSRQEGGLNND